MLLHHLLPSHNKCLANFSLHFSTPFILFYDLQRFVACMPWDALITTHMILDLGVGIS